MYSIVTQIIDNDAKGENGGTKYRLTISKVNEIIESIEYSIVDILNGFKKHLDIISRYRELNLQEINDRDKKQHATTQLAKEQRLSDALSTVSDDHRSLIKKVVNDHPEIVQQYKQGNEKSINVLMGKLLKQLKVAPQALVVVIKQVIDNG